MAASVSVVIPTYNRARYIGQCILSAVKQTAPPLEILVVDDGSTDETAQIVTALAASRETVRYIRKQNGGVASARNVGLAAASGEWIAFLDSDDTWTPDKLANALAVTRSRKDVELVHTNRAKYHHDGTLESVRPFPRTDMEDPRFLLATFCVAIQTMLIRRPLIERMDYLFNTTLRTCSDYEFIFRALMLCKEIAYIESCDTVINLTRESIMRSSKRIDMLFDDLTAISSALERCDDPKLRESLLANHRTRAARLLARTLRPMKAGSLGRALYATAKTHRLGAVKMLAKSVQIALAGSAEA